MFIGDKLQGEFQSFLDGFGVSLLLKNIILSFHFQIFKDVERAISDIALLVVIHDKTPKSSELGAVGFQL